MRTRLKKPNIKPAPKTAAKPVTTRGSPTTFWIQEGDLTRGGAARPRTLGSRDGESQRAMVAAKMANLKHGGDRKSGEIKSAIAHLNMVTRKQAAEMLNVGVDSLAESRRGGEVSKNLRLIRQVFGKDW